MADHQSASKPPVHRSHTGAQAPRHRLDRVCTRDRGRLLQRWRQMARGGSSEPEALQRWAADVDASVARRDARAASKPALALAMDLPIAAHAEDIIALIRKHPVVVIAGETGSGKTTQLPKLCLAAGRGEAGVIGCTQPRRLAARSVARRVAEELKTEVGAQVGYKVRFTDQTVDTTLIKFMTDGILLAETQADRWLSEYDTLIIDEAHERSLNIDFLLGYLKGLLARRRDLKIIITSATIDTARFAAHFDGAPVVEVAGRAFPVEVRFDPGEDRDGPAQGSAQHIAQALDRITTEDPRGDVLVFLPGEREIRDAHRVLGQRHYRHTEILPLYARLSASEQDRVFKPGPARRVVLATNVAETSLTVPRIRYVVDTGVARINRYSQRTQIERLYVEPISRAAADQRKGRCGRVGPGVCVRLYSEADYAARPAFSDPELLRSSLANVILRMLALNLGEVESFPFLDAPESRAVADGYRRLAEVSAIDERQRLTPLGRELARLPIDVQLARMLIEAQRRLVAPAVLIIVAFLSVADPRVRPAEARTQADAAHREFADPDSDFAAIVKLWRAFTSAHGELSHRALGEWCTRHYLSYLRMREWQALHRQIKLALAAINPVGSPPAAAPARAAGKRSAAAKPAAESDNGSASDTSTAIHLCLLAGFPAQVGHKDEHGIYRGARGRKFQIFPGSGLARKPPAWVFAAQLLDMNGKVWGMECAHIEPAWVEEQAAHLLRRSWRDPHWSRERGAVMAFEQVTLFGLVLVERRPVVFRDQDPEQAHAIFVREALARCELDARADFIAANRRVLAQAEDIEARQRRQGLLLPDDERAAFFTDKLPEDVSDARALDAWYRRAPAAAQAALRWGLGDVMRGGAGLDAGAFPTAVQWDGQRYRLSYRFLPGDAADGVTLSLPLALLNAIPATAAQWLVPGMLAEKVTELIRTLPKSLRRNCVPAPEFARAFVETEPAHGQPLVAALAQFLAHTTGAAITADAFAGDALAEHLRMRFALIDERGKTLASGRDLAALREQWQGKAQLAFTHQTAPTLTRDSVDAWDFDDIPERMGLPGKPDAFPALVDLGEAVALRVFARRDEATDEHPRGVQRLLHGLLAPDRARAARQVPVGKATALAFAALGTQSALREDLVEGAWDDVLRAHDLGVRTRAAFEALAGAMRKDLFPAVVARLKIVEAIIAEQVGLRRELKPAHPGTARDSYADLDQQFGSLLAPGFLRDIAVDRLTHYPRYLKAMRIRAERLRRDPGKDHRHLQHIAPYVRAWLQLRADGQAGAAVEHLRWLIEEFRVSLFAQELGTAEPVSGKRLQQALAAVSPSD